MKDQNQLISTAFPAANANANCTAIDLKMALAGGFGNAARLCLRVPALANLVSAKVITFSFEDSADNSSFSAVETIKNVTVTGGASGGAADHWEIPFPQSIRRYVRVNCAVENGGGDNTASSYTLGVEI